MGFRDELLQSPSNDGVDGRVTNKKTRSNRTAHLLRRNFPGSPTLGSAATRKKSLQPPHSDAEAAQKRQNRRERALRRSERERTRSSTSSIGTPKRRSTISSTKEDGNAAAHPRQQQPPIKKQVHFEVDSCSNIVHQYSPQPSKYKLGRRERARLWWTHSESDLIGGQADEIANSFKKDSDYVEKFIDLFAMCAQVDGGDDNVGNEDFALLELQQQENLDDICKTVQTPARGLEVLIIGVLERYRIRHVQAILTMQNDLLKSPSSSSEFSGSSSKSMESIEVRSQHLQKLSQRNSRAGRILAQVLARTDAAVAAEIASSS